MRPTLLTKPLLVFWNRAMITPFCKFLIFHFFFLFLEFTLFTFLNSKILFSLGHVGTGYTRKDGCGILGYLPMDPTDTKGDIPFNELSLDCCVHCVYVSRLYIDYWGSYAFVCCVVHSMYQSYQMLYMKGYRYGHFSYCWDLFWNLLGVGVKNHENLPTS